MGDLKTGYQYSVSTENKNNKSVIFVKLTDSALQSIETYLNSKDVSPTAPTIQFQNNSGVISLPLNSKKHNYGFTLSNVEGDGLHSGFQCLQHINNSSLESLGFMLMKMQIHATEDSYEKTKTKMTAAEQEHKNLCTRELRVRVSRIPPKVGQASQEHCITNMESSIVNLNNKVSCPVTLMQQPIRERIIHILAAKTYKRAELLLRLKREGVSDKDKKQIPNILNEVSNLAGNNLYLQDHIWNEIKEDWEFYSKEESQSIKKKKQKILKSINVNGDADVPKIPIKQEKPSPPHETYTNFCNQKQNTFLNGAKNDKTDQNESQVPNGNNNNNNNNNNSLTNGSTLCSMKNFPLSLDMKPRKRRSRKKNLCEINGISLASNGTSQVRKRKSTDIADLPPLQRSFISEQFRNGLTSVKTEENTCMEPISNGHDINHDENIASDHVVKTEVNQTNNCSNTNISGKHSLQSQFIQEKLQYYKQILMQSLPPQNNSTVNGNRNNGNRSETSAQTVPEYDFSEIQLKYTKVESLEQRDQYAKEFYINYGNYLKLQDEMKEISEKFSNLYNQLQSFTEESPEYKKIKLEMGQEYKKVQKEKSYIASRKKFEFLKAKLSHIKELIEAYDREKFSEL